jgi:Tfp pilus assembly protein PilF
MRRTTILLGWMTLLLALGTSAQDSSTPPAAPPKSAGPPKSSQAASNYNPLPAEKDVEVGTFYMHKGDLDAAIGRFEDAIEQKPNYARPRLLLAEIYEKKKEITSAIKYYKEYLEVYPHASDAKRIQKKIDELSSR